MSGANGFRSFILGLFVLVSEFIASVPHWASVSHVSTCQIMWVMTSVHGAGESRTQMAVPRPFRTRSSYPNAKGSRVTAGRKHATFGMLVEIGLLRSTTARFAYQTGYPTN
jgi:hypothetical protein